jgi:hypothetical protein
MMYHYWLTKIEKHPFPEPKQPTATKTKFKGEGESQNRVRRHQFWHQHAELHLVVFCPSSGNSQLPKKLNPDASVSNYFLRFRFGLRIFLFVLRGTGLGLRFALAFAFVCSHGGRENILLSLRGKRFGLTARAQGRWCEGALFCAARSPVVVHLKLV